MRHRQRAGGNTRYRPSELGGSSVPFADLESSYMGRQFLPCTITRMSEGQDCTGTETGHCRQIRIVCIRRRAGESSSEPFVSQHRRILLWRFLLTARFGYFYRETLNRLKSNVETINVAQIGQIVRDALRANSDDDTGTEAGGHIAEHEHALASSVNIAISFAVPVGLRSDSNRPRVADQPTRSLSSRSSQRCSVSLGVSPNNFR